MTVAVVTGASQGIGQATAIALARGGADVVGSYRPGADAGEQAAAAETVAAIQALGRGCVLVEADAADAASAERLAQTARDELGGLDIWVNNAARLLVRPFLETSDEEWASILGSNVLGYVYGCRAAIRQMLGTRRRPHRQHHVGRAPAADRRPDGLLHGEGRGARAHADARGGVRRAGDLGQRARAGRRRHAAQRDRLHAAGARDLRGAHPARPHRRARRRSPTPSSSSPRDAARYVNGAELVCDGGFILNGSVGHARD